MVIEPGDTLDFVTDARGRDQHANFVWAPVVRLEAATTDAKEKLLWDAAKDFKAPIAALLIGLKQRGLLDDTLGRWGGEFGRTPTSELSHPATTPGRDHNRHGFTVWLAAGGIKGGHIRGTTDDAGFAAVQDKVHVHDLHATILHLLGLDHERLTYRYAGRDFRLTDVHERVVREIMA